MIVAIVIVFSKFYLQGFLMNGYNECKVSLRNSHGTVDPINS